MSSNKIPEIVSKVSVTDSENEEQPEETAASALAALGKVAMMASPPSNSGRCYSDTDDQKSDDGDQDLEQDLEHDHDDGQKEEKEGGGAFKIPQRYTKSGRKRAVPFPIKLMKVLSDKQFADIITWMPSGRSFSIIQPKAFVADVLPEHFKSAKYSSFTRKLHRWGFMRHYRGEEAGAFYHKDFQKDRLDLVEQMTCHKDDIPEPKSTAAKKVSTSPVPTPPSNGAGKVSTVANSGLSAPRMSQMMPQSSPLEAQRPPMPQPRDMLARLRQQQQNLVGLELNSSPVPPPQMLPPQQSQMDAAERLHAAIELEVTRRLKERLQAAALSQNAFSMIQSPSPLPSSAMRTAVATPSPMRPMNTSMPYGGRFNDHNLQAQLNQMQQQKQKQQQFILDPSCYGLNRFPRMANEGLEQLPQTNIPGARTA